MDTIFNNSFFSLSMNQLFNRAGAREPENIHEAPLRKLLRLAGQL